MKLPLMPNDYTLKTDRFLLRQHSVDDMPHIFSASRVKGFNDGLGWDPMPELNDHFVPHQKSIRAWEDGRGYGFTIVSNEDHEFKGRISIRKTEDEKIWNIGYFTHPDFYGQGIMTECIRVILFFGFEKLKAFEIEAEFATWNNASELVLEKNGFQFDKIIKDALFKNGKWYDEKRMIIKKDKWKSQ